MSQITEVPVASKVVTSKVISEEFDDEEADFYSDVSSIQGTREPFV